jgi:DNA-binding NarL/FixJ family response regulator
VENSGIRVILVDDLASTRRALKALLAFESRIDIIGEASDGVEALQLVEDKQPDLVLMDVRMPVMNGLKATEKIKAAWPQIRVVLYTMFPDYQEEAYRAGADFFLIKGCSGVPPSNVILSFFPLSHPSTAEI